MSSLSRRKLLILVVLTAVVTLPFASRNIKAPWFLCEFRGDLYVAAQHIVHGENPYDGAYISRQAAVKRRGGHPVTNFVRPVYPAPALLAAVPFVLLPFTAAALLYLGLSIVAILAALRMLGVTDIRCLAATVFSIPVLLALIDGSLTPFLLLAVAYVWRERDRVRRCAPVLAVAVVAKLFLWPLLVWALVTRRLQTLSLALGLALVALVGGWAAIGFAGLHEYPRMLANLSFVESPAGVSVSAAAQAVGLSSSLAGKLALLIAGLTLLLAARAARRDEGRRAFALAVIAALLATPISWPNYLVLIYVPIALISPAFSPLWLLPLVTFFTPQTQTHGHLLLMVPYLLVEVVVLTRALWTPRRPLLRLGSLRRARVAV